MTLERAVEELVAATIHAEDARRADIMTWSLARIRFLLALNRYQGIAGVKRLRVTGAEVERPMAETG